METIAILGGSYNPVHVGHLMLASYLSQWVEGIDGVWLNLSPKNPLKNASSLAADTHRLAMLRLAARDCSRIGICDIELEMPRPSYTIATLDALRQRYPEKSFRLAIGADNWAIFDRWKDYQRIIADYGVIVYPRRGSYLEGKAPDGVAFVDAPLVDVSSTFIRESIAQGKDMRCFLPHGVADYIRDNKLYSSESIGLTN